ncbi:hypothetical protein MTO96_005103 [Rhipicephalus appendiculatus]
MRLGPQLLAATRTHKQGLHRQESAGLCAELQQEPRQEVSCGALRQHRRLYRQAALRRHQPASRGRGRELRGRPDVPRVQGTSRSSSRRHLRTSWRVGETVASTSRQAFHAQAPECSGVSLWPKDSSRRASHLQRRLAGRAVRPASSQRSSPALTNTGGTGSCRAPMNPATVPPTCTND